MTTQQFQSLPSTQLRRGVRFVPVCLTALLLGSVSAPSASAAPATPTVKFANSRAGLNPKLTRAYADFSFKYPANWALERQGTKADSSNFVKVLHDQGTYTLENFAVGYFNGSMALAPALMKQLEPSFAKGFPNYSRISIGPKPFNKDYNSYAMAFTAHVPQRGASQLNLYGKVFLIPATNGSRNGVCVIMLGTSKSPALRGIADLGTKGDLPTVVNSFHLGK